MRHSDPEGLYRALGVSPAADPDEIKNAYRRLAKETHPDAANGGSEFQFHKQVEMAQYPPQLPTVIGDIA